MFPFFYEKFKKEQKSFFSSSTISYGNSTLSSYDYNYKQLEYFYHTNPVIFRSVNLLSECANSMQITSQDNKVQDYLNINFSHIVTELLIYGNCFLHKDLEILSTNKIQIITNDKKEILAYKYQSTRINSSEILHLKYCSTSIDKFYSISPVQISTKWIHIYQFIENYISGMVRYGGKPSGILTYDSMITEKDRITLREQFAKLYQDITNGGTVILTGGKVSWQSIGMEPEKLNLIENLTQAKKEIANCFGVPEILLGVKDQATFSNYTEARKQLWEDVLIPFVVNIIHSISHFLNIEIYINTHNSSFLNEKLWEPDLLTRDEKRQLLGYPPITTTLVKEVKDVKHE